MKNARKKPTKISIKTFGCQMNMYDTEVAQGMLADQGYQVLAEDPITMKEYVPEADVFIMNTCSVREHAEDRVYSRLGLLGKAKQENPNIIVGLMGCMVEEHRERLFRRYPQLDLMVGTRNIKELPGLIEKVRQSREQVAQIKQDGISIEYTEQIQRKDKFHAWLPIMTGCNKVCTFCIVPITRGSEVSMKARDVYREASRVVDEGVKWITLLGQNVNSYNGASESGKQISFPELLDQLCSIEGLERVSFTTSHPHDATEELYRVIQKNSKISRRFHLPLQSGSDRILKRMKRLHTFEEYKQKIDKMREMIPEISLTTDIIAGFSGETEEDHQATINALQSIRYDGAYIYKYSTRPGTPAAKLEDDVPFKTKAKRNTELVELQRKITQDNMTSWIGKEVEVFVQDQNVKNPNQLRGRTLDEKIVAFMGDKSLIGDFKKVIIRERKNETYVGELI